MSKPAERMDGVQIGARYHMIYYRMPFWPLMLISVAAICTGCQKSNNNTSVPNTSTSERIADTPPEKPEVVEPRQEVEQSAAPVTPETTAATPPAPDATQLEAEAYEPRILLSNTHEATCLLKVGDAVPSVTLNDVEGTQLQLQRRFGEKMTVIVFWTSGNVPALDQFQRLASEVWSSWAGAGVGVVAVNVGDNIELVRELTGEAEDNVASLVDEDGSVFAQFATSMLPRTYLVDDQGKILWFDLEYSRSTRRELQNALTYYLKAGT